jgi:hypothetical protein
MKSGFDHLQDLERQVHAMSRTESPAELFAVLRESCRLAAPRGSVFLVRQGKIRGWFAFGYDASVVEAQRGFSCNLGEGWLGRLAEAADVTSASLEDGETGPDFGQPRAAETVASVVRIQNKPIALLIAERNADEAPWHPEVNGLLVTMAQLRFELDLALRKMQGVPSSTKPEAETAATPQAEAPRAAETTSASAESAPEPTHRVETTVSTEMPGPAKTEEPTGVAPAEESENQEPPELEAARRYAKLVATDIRLYNEEAVVLGRRNGDLDRRLEEHLGRGKETFLRRHPDLGTTGLDLLHEAYVQVLAAGDAKLIPPSVVRS